MVLRAHRSMDEIEAQVERDYIAMTRWLPWWVRLFEWILGHRYKV